ncbi:hypothetical protein Hden_3021 [Hyphomicrobium denitrificans ATCC 51888]|uniref:Uncharacterized protein n=1 Tax=Hyphomicrobium denitrificans (strain ATCC 51888 / DSM 1869 / NCIMB 11706 / TK 0415) TaxID=582899 RepID=D8JVG2_HYPDA|nr:hypothetical protein [Hyphomicrobium denitrificans]ADJ24816.1 hypothetical protein Hden_3021 [Hyphomicrobium denitrificans ATCC 51888]
MTDVSDKDWNALRLATAAAFLKPIDEWRDNVSGKDPKLAMAALAMFVGHMMAGLALELGVAAVIDAEQVGGVIGDTMAEQIALMRCPEDEGVTLQ